MSTEPSDVDPRDERRRAPRIVDLMGESSFPASDPPATWTWDPGGRPPRRSTDAIDGPPAVGDEAGRP